MTPGPRVLFTAEQLRRAAPGGIGTYVRGVLGGLSELDDRGGVEVELLASRPPRSPDPLRSFGYPLRTSWLPGPAMTRAWDRGLVRARGGFDVVHASSVATLDPGQAALVVTVHDLLWRWVPDAYPARGRAWHEAALRRALRRGDHFVVPADAVARDLADAGAPAEAITVIPLGSDHLAPPDAPAAQVVLDQLGVHGPYLLSVGTLEPRKNLPRLVEAYRVARRSLPEPWPLVVVGPDGWGEQLEPEPGVVLAGVVSAGALSALYAGARLLAYVPLVEGFGLPPVEAMSLGAPVVASPLPSTAGAAHEVDPADVESIAHGLVMVATDEGKRHRLREGGFARARELTWSSIARSHATLWARVAASKGRRRG